MEMDEALEAIYGADSEQEISKDEWMRKDIGGPHGSTKVPTKPRGEVA